MSSGCPPCKEFDPYALDCVPKPDGYDDDDNECCRNGEKVSDSECCEGELLEPGKFCCTEEGDQPETEGVQVASRNNCCGGKEVASTEDCCNGTVLSNDEGCCGGETYDTSSRDCCGNKEEGTIYAPNNSKVCCKDNTEYIAPCCGGEKLDSGYCCAEPGTENTDGEIVTDEDHCCGAGTASATQFDPNSTTECCIDDQVVEDCCGGLEYDPDSEECCGDAQSGTIYNPNNSKVCCKDNIEYIDPCCGGKKLDSGYCCAEPGTEKDDGKIVQDEEHCCGAGTANAKEFDPNDPEKCCDEDTGDIINPCCGGEELEDGKKCCGDAQEGEEYDENNPKICCNEEKKELIDHCCGGQKLPKGQFCCVSQGGSNKYDGAIVPSAEHCCGGKEFAPDDPTKCCINDNIVECCGGEELSNGMECCGDKEEGTPHDDSSECCCDDNKVEKKEEEKSCEEVCNKSKCNENKVHTEENGKAHRSWVRHNNYVVFNIKCPQSCKVNRKSVIVIYNNVATCIENEMRKNANNAEDKLDSAGWRAAAEYFKKNYGGKKSSNLGGIKNIFGINCNGKKVTVQVYMRSRFSASGISSLIAVGDFSDCYGNNTILKYKCEKCN